jgi:hypothetical protein
MKKEEFTELVNLLSRPCTGETTYDFFLSAKDILKKTGGDKILELGFNRGSSCLSFLEAGFDSVHSVDIRPNSDISKSLDILFSRHDTKFKYYCMDHSCITKNKDLFEDEYNLVFIDGDHQLESIRRDINTALHFNPKYILFDDYNHPAHRGDVKKLIEEFNFEIFEVYDSDCGQALIKL